MKRIAQFQKVAPSIFIEYFSNSFPAGSPEEAEEAFRNVRIPQRATAGSAGYDFFLPFAVELPAGKSLSIPTGIRAKIAEGWVLMIFPRSGLGFRYRLQLDNTVGIVDADYYAAENEGHIIIRLTNDGRSGGTLSLERGKAFAQGVFVPYGITLEDEARGGRTGGFGSTGV